MKLQKMFGFVFFFHMPIWGQKVAFLHIQSSSPHAGSTNKISSSVDVTQGAVPGPSKNLSSPGLHLNS